MIKKLPTMFFFTLIVLSALLGCATIGEKKEGKHEVETIVEPSKAHEDCFDLSPGQALDYTFESLKPLDFNIHWHEAGKIAYPIEKDGISSDKGSFQSEKQQYYCLMWTNPRSEPVKLKYDYSVKKLRATIP